MDKSPEAFRTISEVAEWLDVPTHVLRFWESRFTQVKPVKRAGGRRYYRPSDMELLGGIKRLLHDDGLTIRGVQKLLRDEGVRHVADFSPPLGTGSDDTDDGISGDVIDGAFSEVPETAKAETAKVTAESQPVPEAPMAEDVPTLPVEKPDKVVPFSRASTTERPAEPAEVEPADEAPATKAPVEQEPTGKQPIEAVTPEPEIETAPEPEAKPDAMPEAKPDTKPQQPAAAEPAKFVVPDVPDDPADNDPDFAQPALAFECATDDDKKRLRSAYGRLVALRERLGGPDNRPPKN